LVVFDVFVLAVFLATGLAELPQGFLAAQPPFCAMVFTSFLNSFRFFIYLESPLHKNKPGISSSGLWLLLDKIVSMVDE
jgi:hypothetical protein